ncbi:tyrosine-protein phosphatase [Lysinibacillus xylanilyticus]|uniref:tyrosine-protein phosphatase n=1 Tax=Lysinibacillus xylanilyticus TaxID=582475 RepID=UPI003805ECCF
MFDIHSHILFGVDDGPKTIEQSLEMLMQAEKEGITDILATSHACHPQYHVHATDVWQQVPQLQQALDERGIQLKIHTGHEVRITDDLLEKLERKEVLPLANSQYVLLELPSSNVPTYTKNMIVLLKSAGITPIIAHPERNKAIAEKPERLERLIREGAVAQITAGSLAGHFGKSIQKLSLDLVQANLVHTYGSDVHNLTTRPFLFDEGLSFLEKKKQLDAVDILLENNARILENRIFILHEPDEIRSKKWWQFI